jgi:hypothetical protein
MPDESIFEEPIEGIVYVDEAGVPEDDQGALNTPGHVIEQMERESAEEAREEEVPPEPAFVIVPNAYGPGTFSAKFPDGTPVGVWLHDEHPSLQGGEVAEMLIIMGMPGELAAWYGIQRDKALIAAKALAAHPGQAAFAAHEEEREKSLNPVREAFIKAQGKKS